MLVSFDKFKGQLPYASGLFGIYQPLLGWRARRITRRFERAWQVRDGVIAFLASKTLPDIRITSVDGRGVALDRLVVGTQSAPYRFAVPARLDSLIARRVLGKIKTHTTPILTPSTIDWSQFVAREVLQLDLEQIQNELVRQPGTGSGCHDAYRETAERESIVAGVLACLHDEDMHETLAEIFFPKAAGADLSHYEAMKTLVVPKESFDPQSAIDRVALSPVGLIHLFRQYFFEFDTFLGPSVQHVWLSPGAVVELVETHSRRVLTERFTEISSESIQRTEESKTNTDELSDAVKEENTNNTMLGVSANIDAGMNMEIFSAHASATVGFGFTNNQKRAREQLHKQTRAQSTKLTNEIKRNHKTSLRTVTETTDVSSKRYVLTNNTSQLVNYELRRKMRQVGVQLQDIGTQLCWQVYVDDPGKALGIAQLVHIAEPADLASLPLPQAPVYLEPAVTDMSISFPYESTTDTEEKDVTFFKGSDQESGLNNNDRIVWQRKYEASPPQHGYSLKSVEVTPMHSSTCVAVVDIINSSGEFQISLEEVNFNDQSAVNLAVKLHWHPPDQKALEDQYNAALAAHEQEKSRLAKEAFLKAARERVRLASAIEERDSMVLRSEERIVVYRTLIGSLLDVGVNLSNPQMRHVMSEMVNALFDVDKMLYFVAPEWWRPRQHPVKQSLGAGNGGETPEMLTPQDVVSWGGADEKGRDSNYYITEDSRPAKLGASLGWLLQLDGDTMRNAFLNAPWVKAVIPIRPGMELQALNWLKSAAVEGVNGLSAFYQEETPGEKDLMATVLKAYPWIDPADIARYGASFSGADVTIEDALRYLAIKIEEKHATSNELQTEVVGPETRHFMPTDKVFDYGFDPLAGGFQATSSEPFRVFDQWVEVLPTDQLVAVQVQYDPSTGFQVSAEAASSIP